jgi:F420-non-reducing hydrogenase iron-sulfur subunit
MCSGSVDSSYVLKALLEGADAVLLGGCHPGDCHYVSGNYKARRRATIMRTVLKTLGLGENRFWVRWISAGEGRKFAETVQEVVTEIKKDGPSPLAGKWSA